MRVIRINKTAARREYEKGRTLYVLPSRTRFDNAWIRPFQMEIARLDNADFDKVINEYEFYNCMRELGKRAAFYVEVNA